MSNHFDRLQRYPFRPGPYGTNEGDIWTMDGSEVGAMLKERNNLIGIWEVMFKDGTLGPCCYTVDRDNPDPEMQALIAEAIAGDERYARAAPVREMWERARRN